MLQKSKPTVNELRPVAPTNISYKLLMGILKCKTEDHIKNSNYINDRVGKNHHFFAKKKPNKLLV